MKRYDTILCLTIWLLALTNLSFGQKLELSTNSDSAAYYYIEGWKQVLDYGHFTNSEKAYRNMYTHDPNFLVGASLLARITPDPSERKALYHSITEKSHQINGDELQLLNLFNNLTKLYILREENRDDELANHSKVTIQSGQDVLGKLAKKYPDDIYYKSEFIEFLHSLHGPQVALDSLNHYFKLPPPFMFGYSAQLLSELRRFEEALTVAKQLEQVMADKPAPYVNMVYAKIFKEQGKKEEALKQLNEALTIDPGHILALRMKSELTKK